MNSKLMLDFKPILRTAKFLENLSFEKMIKAQNQLCFYCQQFMPVMTITKDHIFPKSFGFIINGNMVLAHQKCNNNKSNRFPTIEEVIRWHTMNRGGQGNRLLIATRNDKPRFRLTMTPELIHDYLS